VNLLDHILFFYYEGLRIIPSLFRTVSFSGAPAYNFWPRISNSRNQINIIGRRFVDEEMQEP
jgi:hypothetical protein